MKTNILFFFILLPLLVEGQNNYMSLSFGGIIPISNFGSTANLSENGFALNGFSGDYSGAFFLNKYFGIGGNIKYASNSIDEPLVAVFLQNEAPIVSQDSTANSFRMGIWKQIAMTIGPEITFTTARLCFDLFALSGINFVMPPEMAINIETSNESYSRKLETPTVSYGFDLGIALRYHLSEKTSIRLHGSYFQSSIKGEITKILQEDNNETVTTDNYSCPIQTLNFGIGVVYRL
jgi:hypothetical protein